MTILKEILSRETAPVILSELAEGRSRNKIPEMHKSLQGRISEHQQKILKHQLGHIESLTSLIMDLDADIQKTESINWAIEALNTIPVIGRHSAERILSETGLEMEHFQDESRFSS